MINHGFVSDLVTDIYRWGSWKKSDGKAFERGFVRFLETISDYKTIRTDYKNTMPDFLILHERIDGECFVELKNYTSCETIKEAKKKSISTKQGRKQAATRADLSDNYNVIIVWGLKDELFVETL